MLGLPKDEPIKFFGDAHHSICCDAPAIVREFGFWGKNDKPFLYPKCYKALDFTELRRVSNEATMCNM